MVSMFSGLDLHFYHIKQIREIYLFSLELISDSTWVDTKINSLQNFSNISGVNNKIVQTK